MLHDVPVLDFYCPESFLIFEMELSGNSAVGQVHLEAFCSHRPYGDRGLQLLCTEFFVHGIVDLCAWRFCV